MALGAALRKIGATTDVSKLSNKVTHVIMSTEFEADSNNAKWIDEISSKAPDAEVISETQLKQYF